jgi:hypothetical protein
LHKTVLRIVTTNLRMSVSRGVNAADRADKKTRPGGRAKLADSFGRRKQATVTRSVAKGRARIQASRCKGLFPAAARRRAKPHDVGCRKRGDRLPS